MLKTKFDYIKVIITITLSLFCLVSCEWFYRPGPCDASGPVVVYKTKFDYSNNVTVQLSKDKKRVTAYPGPGEASRQKPIKLANGYLFKRMVGDAVTSLQIDEYSKTGKIYTAVELFNLIIDINPYTEKYECCECTKRDTILINQIIRNNEISNCCENIN